ncbi:3-deoxy-7-phosphoheptulonate synthase [Mucisphaera calidilacus]|uniref:Phospho-2-dehydro-3-deoxyheptonate aldolase n=1 Tax=Mucisphaera calidilacus TaxID=2527982 RepID=A0A518BV99_9BACT|nr:3-deoxy-7-phosphoheptulonate synthase [Mucisphaera calidilacus]QDU70896.1 Phospho-2-dehydro-3-deoxyheptonate aldolase [Mucisphaera calidilacus]
MIIVMRAGARQEQVDHVCERVREMGLQDHPIVGTDLTVVAVIGDENKVDGGVIEQLPGVDRVMRVMAKYKMAALAAKDGRRSEIEIAPGVSFGGTLVPVIAGPCSVESAEHILACAQAVKASGAHALRGGAFKPRTNPYAFQGHGEEGLKMLAAAREATGLPIVTEVLTPSEVGLVSEYADCLQIGTRNAQNFKLLQACGQQPKPVLYKRGMAMTIEEYLQAAEYILAAGNPNVILCERGIRTFEDHTRNTLSLSAVPELHQRTHLPVVIDPSHGTGHARLVPDMARAAMAAGADGLAIEMHPDPEHAMTDGAQSITPEALTDLIVSLARVAAAVDRTCGAEREVV